MAERPNVLVFFTDQQRWDTCGCYGANPMGLTPELDRMAARGTRLRRSFTTQPVCGPARACLQTGRYATQTGCWKNDIPLPPGERTIAHRFRTAGYWTGYVGKWHLANTKAGPVPPGQRGGYDGRTSSSSSPSRTTGGSTTARVGSSGGLATASTPRRTSC